MDDLGDQIDAAFRAGEGYSTLASSFHPALRSKVESLVHRPRSFPPAELLLDQLPEPLEAIYSELKNRAVNAATESPGTYIVWDRYPEVNWPVPLGYNPPIIGRWLLARYGDRCGWCGRPAEEADGLLASAGSAIALLSLCKACRYNLAEDFGPDCDLFWI